MYTLKVNLPNSAKGAEVVIDGLGSFENGKTYDINEELATQFRTYHQQTLGEHDAEGNFILNLTQGPTLLEAAKTMHGIEVKTTPKKAAPKKPKAVKAVKEEPKQDELPLDEKADDKEVNDND